MAERTALMYREALGISSGSASLTGRKPDLYPLQLYSLSKAVETAGDALTWGTVSSYDLPIGPDTTPRYTGLTAGYSYSWNANTGIFTVTGDLGATTIYTGIYTWKELGVTWGILSSNQFRLVYMLTTGGDIFLVGKRQDAQRISQTSIGQFSYNTFLEEAFQHAVFNRLAEYTTRFSGEDAAAGGSIREIIEVPPTPIGNGVDRTILLAETAALQSDANYTLALIPGSDNQPAARERIERTGLLPPTAHFVMIALFAQNLLSANRKVLFEPWMLWSAYQWYFNTFHSAASSRQIFDLSPRW